jgi:hypothetical protein
LPGEAGRGGERTLANKGVEQTGKKAVRGFATQPAGSSRPGR